MAGHPERIDDECDRAGTSVAFKFCEPLGGWRGATARERRTDTDRAREVAEAVEGRLLHGVRSGPGIGAGATHWIPLYAAARERAEHRGERAWATVPTRAAHR